MQKTFEHRPFNIEELRQEVFPGSIPDPAGDRKGGGGGRAFRVPGSIPDPARDRKDPLDAILEQLEKLNCKTVLIETGYVDPDYLSEYSAFYSTRFKRYDGRCSRLHFFNVAFDQDLQPEKYTSDSYSDKYLGFIVLRPTEFNRIGRTVIRPLIDQPQTRFITCLVDYTANILGHSFIVTGTPFLQQDTQVSSCAQAAIWMAGRYLSRHFALRDFLPAEITTLAQSRSPRSREFPAGDEGLTSAQILDAFHGMGLSPTLYHRKHVNLFHKHLNVSMVRNPDDSDAALLPAEVNAELRKEIEKKNQSRKFADIAYKYIESRLPVILAIKDHAFVAIGHTYNNTAIAQTAIERIPAFIIHDDGGGPYLDLPIDRNIPCKFPMRRRNEDDVECSFDDVHSIIVLTPPCVMLSGIDAEAAAIFSIKELPVLVEEKAAADDLESRIQFGAGKFEYRTYLISSIEFQKALRSEIKQGQLLPEVAWRIIKMDFPRYLWITEFTEGGLLKTSDKNQRRCLGRVIIDSTAAKKSPSVLALHAFDYLVRFDRNGALDPDVKLFSGSTPVRQHLAAIL